MTTEQIKALRASLLPGHFNEYRQALREEARRLGHNVGANDIIKLLEANANDDNAVNREAVSHEHEVAQCGGNPNDPNYGRGYENAGGDGGERERDPRNGGGHDNSDPNPNADNSSNGEGGGEGQGQGQGQNNGGGTRGRPQSQAQGQPQGEQGQVQGQQEGRDLDAEEDSDWDKWFGDQNDEGQEGQGNGEGQGQGEGEGESEGGEQEGQEGHGEGQGQQSEQTTEEQVRQKQRELERKRKATERANQKAEAQRQEQERMEKELNDLQKKLEDEQRRKQEEEEQRQREERERQEREMQNIQHYKTDELIETLKTTSLAYLVGPAGTGKTTLAMDACAKLFECAKGDTKFNLHFAQISFSPDTTAGEMIGRTDVNGVFHESEVVRVFRDGGLILFDEIDNADASMLVKLNTAIANGTIATPAGLIKRNPEAYIVCTANTFGTGADAMYVGRTRLDAATLDRFTLCTIEVDYDTELEKKISSRIENEVNRNWLLNFVRQVRKVIGERHLRRLCSTRFVINATKWMCSGKDMAFVKDKFLLGWSDNERNYVTAATA